MYTLQEVRASTHDVSIEYTQNCVGSTLRLMTAKQLRLQLGTCPRPPDISLFLSRSKANHLEPTTNSSSILRVCASRHDHKFQKKHVQATQ